MFLPAYLPFLAVVRNGKASFPGEIHTVTANTGWRAPFYLIRGEIPVMAEPHSPVSFISSLITYVTLHTNTAPTHSYMPNKCTSSMPRQHLTFHLSSCTPGTSTCMLAQLSYSLKVKHVYRIPNFPIPLSCAPPP